MGNVFRSASPPEPAPEPARGERAKAMPSPPKHQRPEEPDVKSGEAGADAASESSSGEEVEPARKVPFSLDELKEEVESLRNEPPQYVKRVGVLQVPNLICDKRGNLEAPKGEGPWRLTVTVAGGEPDPEAVQLASTVSDADRAAKICAEDEAKVESELLEARQTLEELSTASDEFATLPSVGTWLMPLHGKGDVDDTRALDEAACKVQELEVKLVELKAASTAAKDVAKHAHAAKEKVQTASAYNHSFAVGIQFDKYWPVKPPIVRFQGVFHHALVDDSGGMLLPFYRTLPKDPQKQVNTLRWTLAAIHHFLKDPLDSWGIARDAAPLRLISSMNSNEKMNQQRLDVISKYRKQVRHEELFQDPPCWRQEWFDPTFWEAYQRNTPEAWRAILEEHLTNEVFAFKIFTDEFCDFLVEEIFNFYASGLPARRPNSMNNYGIILNEIGLEPMIDELQRMLQPVGDLLFTGPGSMWDGHHCFIVRYREGEDLGLDMHTDDSDVTFNICLGLDFDGAGLQFCGLMGSANHRKHTHTYKHKKGTVVCHLGRKRHGADDISRGERLNLILWNHSSTYRNSDEYENPNYVQEEGPPDQVCVSYTHDRDYGNFKDYPKGKEQFKGRGWCPPKPFEYEGFKPDAEKEMLGG
eukprot:TRINITY_DN16617_c0_g1_i2.p1 TRINITY_DN16617_c0_g1~~TRINITY_DN16617_c0_g1_i2.p1  ORF type:complete len:650 (+),score=126.15 TRINITY_DN16617_c0_g1_i2:25-1950(+)